ncbi:MAG: dual specificity protein phosphatase family protein [Gemmataceae bacterium]
MATPQGFSWIERPWLAALALPRSVDDLHWLRQMGIDVLISLTEDRLRRDWVNESGLLNFHEPLQDMEPPTLQQLQRSVSAILKAREQGFHVAVHCGAGLGRTGVVLAAYFVTQGLAAPAAINRIRKLRPNSVETKEQEAAVEAFAHSHAASRSLNSD